MQTEIDARLDSEKRGIARPATIFSRAAVAPHLRHQDTRIASNTLDK